MVRAEISLTHSWLCGWEENGGGWHLKGVHDTPPASTPSGEGCVEFTRKFGYDGGKEGVGRAMLGGVISKEERIMQISTVRGKLVVVLGTALVLIWAGCDSSSDDQPSSQQQEWIGDEQYAKDVPGDAAALAADQTLIKFGQGYGRIRFGMTREELVAAVGEPQRKVGLAYEYLDLGFAVLLDDQGQVGCIMCGDANPSGSPLVKRFKGQTPEGIGMGSSPEEVTQAYGEPDSRSLNPYDLRGVSTTKYRTLGVDLIFCDNKLVHIVISRPRAESSQENAF